MSIGFLQRGVFLISTDGSRLTRRWVRHEIVDSRGMVDRRWVLSEALRRCLALWLLVCGHRPSPRTKTRRSQEALVVASHGSGKPDKPAKTEAVCESGCGGWRLKEESNSAESSKKIRVARDHDVTCACSSESSRVRNTTMRRAANGTDRS